MPLIYCDHNATTPLDPAVRDAMLPWLDSGYGNPSSVHSLGRNARYAVEKARQHVARLIGSPEETVIFTSGGTESDNLAILGAARANRDRGMHIITSAIEHPAVLGACEMLGEEGFEITHLPPDTDGIIHPEMLAAAIRADTVLVSIMAANNETGVIQKVRELAETARQRGCLFHTDAVQAAGRIPIDAASLGADLLSLSAHKMYGPKGIGALYVRQGVEVLPLVRGGHQESGLRSGTENVAAIAGFGAAAAVALEQLESDGERIASMRDRLEKRLVASIPDTKVVGRRAKRIPGVLNACFEGVSGTYLVLALDERGIAASTGSACSAGNLRPSHVLEAMRVPEEYLQGGLRLSLGRFNTAEEIDSVCEVLAETVADLRAHPPREDGGWA